MPGKYTRRTALKTMAGSAALLGLGNAAFASETAPGALKGAINHTACRWCYSKIDLDTLCAAAKEIGLVGLDLLDPSEFATVKKHGLICTLSNGPTTIPDGFNRIENHVKYVPACKDRLAEVAAAGFPAMIVFSGNRKGMSDEQGLENCTVGLKQIMATAEKLKVNVIMELLNSKVDHADYMCDHTAWGVELVKRVGSDRFKLLYDIYHMQIMEGDVIRTIRDNHSYIGHYHTGGNPGRNEIDETQELYYPAIMRAITETGFKGFVAQEFIPKRDPLTSLRQAVQICDV